MGSSERRSGAWMTAVIGLGLLVVAGAVVGVLVLLGVGTTSAVRSVVADDGDRIDRGRVDGVDGGADLGRRPVPAPRARRLGPPYRAGNPCTSDYAAEVVEETDQQVTVAVTERSPKVDREFGCNSMGYFRTVDVALDRPLAGRTVVDSDGAVHEVFDGTTLLDPVVPDGWTITSEGAGGVLARRPPELDPHLVAPGRGRGRPAARRPASAAPAAWRSPRAHPTSSTGSPPTASGSGRPRSRATTPW